VVLQNVLKRHRLEQSLNNCFLLAPKTPFQSSSPNTVSKTGWNSFPTYTGLPLADICLKSLCVSVECQSRWSHLQQLLSVCFWSRAVELSTKPFFNPPPPNVYRRTRMFQNTTSVRRMTTKTRVPGAFPVTCSGYLVELPTVLNILHIMVQGFFTDTCSW